MKATGIVRRVDDLGRVVIPKEIRRKFKIIEGSPLELFINEKDGEIIFKRYETDHDITQRMAEEAGKPCYELFGCRLVQIRGGVFNCQNDCSAAIDRRTNNGTT